MKIIKVLNNNAVICEYMGGEAVATGRGIAFGRHAGEDIPQGSAEKLYRLSGTDNADKIGTDAEKFGELISGIPSDIVAVSEEIISLAANEYSLNVSPVCVIPLADHIDGALERSKQGITLSCPIAWDVRHYYPKEYEIGERAASMLRSRGIFEPDPDEAAFIALHIVASCKSEVGAYDSAGVTSMIHGMLNIIKYTLKLSFDEASPQYTALLSHVRIIAEQISRGDSAAAKERGGILEDVKRRYPESAACASRVAMWLKASRSVDIAEEEEIYLTMKLEKLRTHSA